MSLANVQNLSSVLNFDELLTRCLNNLDFAERMLALFQSRCAEDLVELEQAFDMSDFDSVRRIAHRLAGAAANAAAFGVQARAAELRQAVAAGSLDEARERLTELREEWDRFTGAMSEGQQSLSPTKASCEGD